MTVCSMGWAVVIRRLAVVGVTLVLVATMIAAGAPHAGAKSRPAPRQATDRVEVQEVRTVWTGEYGVRRPAGVAYDPARQEFLVAGSGRRRTPILRLGTDAEGRGRLSLPRLDHPSTLAFDPTAGELTVIDGGDQVTIDDDQLSRARPPIERDSIAGFGIDSPDSATFDPDNGTWYVLDGDTIAVVDEAAATTERIELRQGAADDGLVAYNASDDLLYVIDVEAEQLNALSTDGEVQRSFSLADTTLAEPVAMTFAPSSDPTDDGDALNLFVADSGSGTTFGGVTELAFATSAVAAAAVDTATLVQTIDTSRWSPASPDPSGVAWLSTRDQLVVVDSEVEETTGAGWHNVNMWRTTRTGSVAGTGTFWGPQSAGNFGREPTGADHDPATNTLFVSDDSADRVFVIKPGTDGNFGTSDDAVTSISTAAFGSTDTEDPVFDASTGDLFILDGVGMEIYRVDPVDGVFGNSNDSMTHFDISHLGPKDFEGLAADPARHTLYVGARTTEQIFEITQDGTLLRTVDVPNAGGLRFISGLGVAPSSTGSGEMHFYIADRAIDNGPDPNENDGKVFEFSAPNIGGGGGTPTNQAPVAGNDAASTVTGSPVAVQVLDNDSDPDGDPLTVTNLTQPANGAAQVGPGQAVTYTPDAGFTGTDTFTYRANDGQTSSNIATVTVTVAAGNTAPSVDAGTNQTVVLPATASLDGTVSDDGLPNPPGAVTTTWTKVSGPGTVTFGNASEVDTTATFSTTGTYVLRLAAGDGELTTSDDVTVTVSPPSNTAPTVNAGADQTVVLPTTTASLDATVSDDGLPNPPGAVTTTWTKVSGPGTVTFGNASAVDTTATFSTTGTYVLRLTAGDGELTTSDDVTVTHAAVANQTITRRIAASSDDAEESASGSVGLGSSDLELVQESTLQTVGLRFPDLTVPHGATIVSATVQFKADERDADASDLTFRAQAANNAPTFVKTVGNITSRPTTTASAVWSPPAWNTVGEEGPAQRTSDISAVVQEVVDRPGWASGNALALIVTGSGKRVAESFDGDAAGAPMLELEYTGAGQQRPQVDAGPETSVSLPGEATLDGTVTDDGLPDPPGAVTTTWSKVSGPGTVTFGDASAVDTTATFSDPGDYVLRLTADDGELSATDTVTVTAVVAGSQVIEQRIAVGRDDAEESATGSVSTGNKDLELVQEKTVQTVGLRFRDLALPQGATIVSATVQFKADETDAVDTDLTFRAQAADDAPLFTTNTNDISSRQTTTASAAWSPAAWNLVGEEGPAQRTSDISAVVQEVVDRPGWASGNALALVVTGSGKRVAVSFNGEAAGAPMLSVSYTVD